MTRRSTSTSTIRTQGALLPSDLLDRVRAGDAKLEGASGKTYGLPSGIRLSDAISTSWNTLRQHWADFQKARQEHGENLPGTEITRTQWLAPLFYQLGFGELKKQTAPVIDEKTYPIERFWGDSVPMHWVGYNIPIDRRTKGVRGAALASPHSLVQEYLNRSDDHLWAFISNGLQLRILRDNVSLSRQAFVEFDLETMMEGEVFADFSLLWQLCHKSRFEAERPELCWLEKWSQEAKQLGTRVLEDLRNGVEQTIRVLGSGFLDHPQNDALRQRLQDGDLSTLDYYRQILRVVYRLLFLFTAEDRDLFHPEGTPAKARQIYGDHYSTARLREQARAMRGNRHGDLWHRLSLLFDFLEEDGCQALGIPALGSFLWEKTSTPDLTGPNPSGTVGGHEPVHIANEFLLDAIRALAYTEKEGRLRRIDYRNLGTEELGSVYESLLELTPEVQGGRKFELKSAAGNERKTSGSYYTPDSLVQCLLDSALEPVVKDRLEGKKGDEAEEALLAITVCDPACGSGHFLISAAHRLARHLARIRSGDEEPSPEVYQPALRDVIGHCVYGVDINPMSAELCRVALWMESIDPGKPLSFLDHKIQVGNSLLGTTPALIAKGIPDDAFKPIEGDEQAFARVLTQENRKERRGEGDLLALMAAEPKSTYGELASQLSAIEAQSETDVAAVKKKQTLYEKLLGSEEYKHARLIADAWCSAFVWKKMSDAPLAVTEDLFRNLKDDSEKVPAATLEEITRLSQQYQFLHWHITFPDVFQASDDAQTAQNVPMGWDGGFDVMLGNPPWERIKLQEKEWFATRDPEIADAPNADARRRKIAALATENPELLKAFEEARRASEGASHLVRNGGHLPLCGRGDVNTYTIFTETMRNGISASGGVGCIVPSGIATDDTTKYFFQDIVEKQSLVSLFDIENAKPLFAGVHRSTKFCLLTLTGIDRPAAEGAEFSFFAHEVEDFQDPERRFRLTSEEVHLLNPNTHTCPVFRTRRDAEITKGIYRRVPVLIEEGPPEKNPWGLSFKTMFHMSNDSGLFRTKEQLEEDGWTLEGNIFHKEKVQYVPLYEAKMVHHYDHRFGDYSDLPEGSSSTQLPEVPIERLQDPDYAPLPRYWVPKSEVAERLAGRWDREWLLGFRGITNTTNERTVIAGVIPKAGIGNSFPLLVSDDVRKELWLLGVTLASLACDFAARFKLGGSNFNFFIVQQIPVLAFDSFQIRCRWSSEEHVKDWLKYRVLELVYTSDDLQGFAKDCSYVGPTFFWDEERRFHIRCELDAAFFHLYGIDRGDVDYIMETFPIIKKKDIARTEIKDDQGNVTTEGTYITKDTILEIYDAMQEAIDSGKPYQTRLDPPPGPPTNPDGTFADLPQWKPGEPRPADWPSHIHPPREVMEHQRKEEA